MRRWKTLKILKWLLPSHANPTNEAQDKEDLEAATMAEETYANISSDEEEAIIFRIVIETDPTWAKVASRTDPEEATDEKYDIGRSDPKEYVDRVSF